jgi:hypothetical protein
MRTRSVRATKTTGPAQLQLMTLLHIAAKCEHAPVGLVVLVYHANPENAKKSDNTGVYL